MKHGFPVRRSSVLGAAGLLATALLAGCSGGPDMGGLEPAAFYARYSGTWAVDDEAADRVQAALDAHRQDRRPGMLPPLDAGRRPGDLNRRPSGAGPEVDPDALRVAMRLARQVPDRLTLLVNDSTVTVAGLHAAPLVLPLGREVVVSVDGTDVEASVGWNGAILVLTRSIDRAAIVDWFEPVLDGRRMLVTRRVALGPAGAVEVTYGADRERGG
jgi:hypothetical protein